MTTSNRSHWVIRHSRMNTLGVSVTVALLAGACAPATTTPTSTPTSSPPATAVATPTSTVDPNGAAPITPGRHTAKVIGAGSYPAYTVVVPSGWYDEGGAFTVKYPGTGAPMPVLGLSVWDVAQVFHDPCHWQGQGYDPGPSVANLVAALVAEPTRNASAPTEVTLSGVSGKYLEWSVPANLKSSTWTQFDACDIDSDGNRDFLSWLSSGGGQRYEQVAGQVDRLWVLDVNAQRLVVDATYSPDTSQSDRAALQQVVDLAHVYRPIGHGPRPGATSRVASGRPFATTVVGTLQSTTCRRWSLMRRRRRCDLPTSRSLSRGRARCSSGCERAASVAPICMSSTVS